MSGRSTEKFGDQSAEWLQVATWFLSRQRKIKDINSGIRRCGLRSPYVLQVSSGIIIDSKKSSPYDSRNGASASAGHPVRTHVRNIKSRSEEHTSELQSLMRISYDVFCLKKKITNIHTTHTR